MAKTSMLIADIGGTNARFALATPDAGHYSSQRNVACADFETAADAMRYFLDGIGAPRPAAICIAAAGPIVDDRVRFTNNPWVIDANDLKKAFGIDKVQLLNDFEAIAYSLPLLQASDLLPIGLPESRTLDGQSYTVGVIGPGTGLGAVGLKYSNGRLMPIVGEASHAGFAPESQVQMELLDFLRGQFDRVSSERLISGAGLENIYRAVTQIHGDKRAPLSAAEIFARSGDNTDARASEAIGLFFEILGQFAGDFALTIGAADGIFIAGGIVKRFPERILDSRFRSGFENKGRHRSLMERIPAQLIIHDDPGLLGAAWCAPRLTNSARSTGFSGASGNHQKKGPLSERPFS